MRESDLRAVLLVKAIEEVDREAVLLVRADREDAARQARRAGADGALARRAKILLARVVSRHSIVGRVAEAASGPAWIVWVLIAVGFAVGLGLSALDGTRRINVLAFPLLGLVAWNLAVYAVVIASQVRSHKRRAPPRRAGPSLLAHAFGARIAALATRLRAIDALLSDALARFLAEWQEAARGLLLARAALVLHLAAAAVGVGLVAGLYARGIAFDYQASWESTFLDASGAHALLSVFYAPASWLTGITIPDVARLDAIRGPQGAERAAPWIHLLAATAVIYVVLPRLALAAAAGLSAARRARAMPVPPSVRAYERAAFGGVGGLLDLGDVALVPVAYEPSGNALARLRTLLGAEMGARMNLQLRPPVSYGEEEGFVTNAKALASTDGVVLLFNLASTPEDENHGLVISGVRDALARAGGGTRLEVLVDEGPYRERMAGDAARLESRRRAWRDFVAARGVEPRMVDLHA